MSSGNEFGVDPRDAYVAGSGAEAYADGFSGLSADFEDIINAAKGYAGTSPYQFEMWQQFSEEQVGFMEEVQRHGVALGNNAQSGATDAQATDSEVAGEFPGGLNRPLNQ